jgi:P4 family phage/plasmid primase-like protien
MSATLSTAERMMALFPTSTRVHGTYNPDPKTFVTVDGKVKPKYRTYKKPVTIDMWGRHVAGEYPIVAALACDDGTTKVSVTDIDDYAIDIIELIADIKALGLPLFVRKSKSGGAHVFAFHAEPITVAVSEKVSRGIARALGYADDDKRTELFPRVQAPDANPLQINMPFCGDNGAILRPGSKVAGGMLLDQFLNAVEFLTTEQRAALIKEKKPQQQQQSPASDEDASKVAFGYLNKFSAEMSAAKHGDHRNKMLTRYAQHMGRMIPRYIDYDTVYKDFSNAIVPWGEQARHEDTLKRMLARGMKKPVTELSPANYVSDGDHMARARKMRDIERPHLLHYRDDFMDFENGAYVIISDGVISAETWTFLDKAMTIRGKDRARMPFLPDRKSVGETLAALKAVSILDPDISAPCWLDGRSGSPPCDLISFPNGLFNVRDNTFHPSDTNFFTTAALGFDYVATAPDPKNWKKFLSEIYHGDDSEKEIAAVQEMFGYLLTADTSLEKAFMFIGPKRSGKGTMLRVLQHLLAPTSVAGPALKSLGTNFGLAPLIGKQVAIIDDLRIGSPKDTDVLIENVLKITGRGFFTIDRKFKSAWNGMLPIKLVLVSNVLPKLGDDSAALANRFLISNTRVSFYDKEDPFLFQEKLLPEIPGIFHWSLVGLHRLRGRGRFEETDASNQAKDRLAHLGSPVMGFIAEKCDLHPDKVVPKNLLYWQWCTYAQDNGLYKYNKENFFEALYAAAGGKVHGGKPRGDGGRIPSCFGIDLKERPKSSSENVPDEELPF